MQLTWTGERLLRKEWPFLLIFVGELKAMKVTRMISRYSNATDKLLNEYNIDHIPLHILKEILKKESAYDPDLYMIHKLDDSQLTRFAEYVSSLLQAEEKENVELHFECYRVG